MVVVIFPQALKKTTGAQFHLAGNEDWNEDKTEELEQDECLKEN